MPAAPQGDLVRRSREEDGVASLVLAHPPVNALSTAVLAELDLALGELEHDAEARCLIVSADGPQFSAGADLKELATLDASAAPEVVKRGQTVLQKLAELPIPSVAAVHGLAVGGGLELALACDFRIADDSAKFGAPEVQHGLMPAWGGTQRLSRLVGLAKAEELCMTGSLVSSAEALRLGLVNKTVPGGQELRAARDLAHTIGQRAPRAVRAVKQAVRGGASLPLHLGLALEAELVTREILPSSDLAEGLRAFAERRPPRFTGK